MNRMDGINTIRCFCFILFISFIPCKISFLRVSVTAWLTDNFYSYSKVAALYPNNRSTSSLKSSLAATVIAAFSGMVARLRPGI